MARTRHIGKNSPMIMLSAGLALLTTAGLTLIWGLSYRSSLRHTRKQEAYQTALQLLDRMIINDPTNAMAYWQKGEVYEALGMHDKALQYYRVAHEMCPRAYAYFEFSSAYERLKTNLRRQPARQLLGKI